MQNRVKIMAAHSKSSAGAAHPWRVHVSGLAKAQVGAKQGRPRERGHVDEEALTSFFSRHNCKVQDVRLMVDTSSKRCRGFAFVDFADQASFCAALQLTGQRNPIGLDLDSKQVLKIEAANPHEDICQKTTVSRPLQTLLVLESRNDRKAPTEQEPGLPPDQAWPYRVFISGLSKTPVSKSAALHGQVVEGVEEKAAITNFFTKQGCRVKDCRLMVDPSSKRCRGFAFVDFEDEASLQRAKFIDGRQAEGIVKLDVNAKGVLKIEAPKPKPEDLTGSEVAERRVAALQQQIAVCASPPGLPQPLDLPPTAARPVEAVLVQKAPVIWHQKEERKRPPPPACPPPPPPPGLVISQASAWLNGGLHPSRCPWEHLATPSADCRQQFGMATKAYPFARATQFESLALSSSL